MRNKTLLLTLCLSASLLGCSSKPSEKDIAAGVNAFWAGCVKVSDVTKTNGVENGNTYRVAYTYKLEFPEDGVGIFSIPPNCSMAGGAQSQAAALVKIMVSSGGGGHAKGDVYTVTNETDMVKSEKGWIFQ